MIISPSMHSEMLLPLQGNGRAEAAVKKKKKKKERNALPKGHNYSPAQCMTNRQTSTQCLPCVCQNSRNLFGPESNFCNLISFKSSCSFYPETTAKFLVDLRFYCLTFKMNENGIFVGK